MAMADDTERIRAMAKDTTTPDFREAAHAQMATINLVLNLRWAIVGTLLLVNIAAR